MFRSIVVPVVGGVISVAAMVGDVFGRSASGVSAKLDWGYYCRKGRWFHRCISHWHISGAGSGYHCRSGRWHQWLTADGSNRRRRRCEIGITAAKLTPSLQIGISFAILKSTEFSPLGTWNTLNKCFHSTPIQLGKFTGFLDHACYLRLPQNSSPARQSASQTHNAE